jgi:phage tail sheath gpL-like
MAQSNLASDKRRPGTFHYFDDTSGSRSLIPIDKSLALVGIKSSAGTATANVPIQAFNESEAETYAGKGSELSLMARMAFATMRKRGVGMKLWLVPLAAAGGGTANTRTLTVTGTATANGDAVIRIAGRTFRVPIKVGDVQNTVAASIKVAIDPSLSDIPFTVGVATNVATLTAVHAGVNHNAAIVEVVSAPAGTSIAAAVGVAGAGVSSIVTALDALGSRDYLGLALGNHLAQDITDLGTHLDAMWAASKKRYRHAFLGETGTLGTATTLATAANRKDIVIAAMEASPSLPGEIAAAVAVMAQSKDRPSYNYDGT